MWPVVAARPPVSVGRRSAIFANPLHVLAHHSCQPLPLREAFLQLREQAQVLLCERFTVVFLLLSANVAAGSEHETMLADALDCLALAEPGYVAVGPSAVLGVAPPNRRWLAAPLTKGVHD